jgi:hypothetical protein
MSEHNESLKTTIFLFSGRDSKFRDETEKWLSKNQIPHDFIVMRPEKDNRPDTVVKSEMYEKYIKDKYRILRKVNEFRKKMS